MCLQLERLDMGATWNLETIKSEKTGLPQSVFATFYKTIFGNRLKMFKVCERVYFKGMFTRSQASP